MTFAKLEIILFSLTVLLCASAVHIKSRDASHSHIGYLYDRPSHSLEEGVKDLEEDDENFETEEESSTKSLHFKETSDEYLEPRKDSHHHLKGRNARNGKFLPGKHHERGGRHHRFL